MIKHVPNTTLVGARVWYAIEKGELYIPAIVDDQKGSVVTLRLLDKRGWRPRLDLTVPEHAAMLHWRTGYRIPGDPEVEYHSVHRPNAKDPLI